MERLRRALRAQAHTWPAPARYAVLGAVVLGIAGGIVGLVVGLRTYAPTAWAATFEVGVPAALVGAMVGLVVGSVVAPASVSVIVAIPSHDARASACGADVASAGAMGRVVKLLAMGSRMLACAAALWLLLALPGFLTERGGSLAGDAPERAVSQARR